MTHELEKYIKCMYCKHCIYPECNKGLCMNFGTNTIVNLNDVCVFFDVHTDNSQIETQQKWQLKTCGLHGCHVTPSRYNADCECTKCFGTHCNDCTVRKLRCSYDNIFKIQARCAFCQHEK